MYGEQTGEVVQTTATATAAECCTACKGSTQCNTWNYCYCNRGCGNNPKGTCLLKNQTNPFYPRCCWDLLHNCSSVIIQLGRLGGHPLGPLLAGERPVCIKH